MPHRARQATGQDASAFFPTTRISNPGPSAASTVAGISADSALTIVTISRTSTVTSGSSTFTRVYPVPVVITNTAQFASLTATSSVQSPGSSSSAGSSNSTAASAASQTATSHKSSNSHHSTLIPAIVVPIVVVVLLAALGAFWFVMRRRHYHAVEEGTKFEKAKSIGPPRTAQTENGSRAHLVGASAGSIDTTGTIAEKGMPATVQVTRALDEDVNHPPRYQSSEYSNVPPTAIGVARSTSSASPVPSQSKLMPPRSAHSMRDPPPTQQANYRSPRSPALSGSDIIDAYGGASPEPRSHPVRPSTAPNSRAKGLPAHPLVRHPSNSNRDLAPRNRKGPPPAYAATTSPLLPDNPQFPSSSPRTASPAVYPLPTQARARDPPKNKFSPRALAGSPDSSSSSTHGLTEENLRIARLVNGSLSSLGMARNTPDNASISDIDEHDRARVASPTTEDDAMSDVSSMDEEQERMASRSGWTSQVENGFGSGHSSPRVGGPGAFPLTPL